MQPPCPRVPGHRSGSLGPLALDMQEASSFQVTARDTDLGSNEGLQFVTPILQAGLEGLSQGGRLEVSSILGPSCTVFTVRCL